MHHRHLSRDLAFAASAITDTLWLSRHVNPAAPTVFHCFGRKALLDDDCWLFRKNLISECAAISECSHYRFTFMSLSVDTCIQFLMFHTVVNSSGSSLHSESFYLN